MDNYGKNNGYCCCHQTVHQPTGSQAKYFYRSNTEHIVHQIYFKADFSNKTHPLRRRNVLKYHYKQVKDAKCRKALGIATGNAVIENRTVKELPRHQAHSKGNTHHPESKGCLCSGKCQRIKESANDKGYDIDTYQRQQRAAYRRLRNRS